MHIRQEKPEDYEEIYRLVKTAFETAAVKDGDEQDYVIDLRKSSSYIPELALVAVESGHRQEGGKLIGHIMLTHTELVCRGTCYNELVLSPICVELAFRGTCRFSLR